MKLLVIEDDREAAAYISKGLVESGYVVDVAHEGRDGLFMASSGSYDALVVDRMLPAMDGLAVIAALRAAEIRVPVLILSALGAVDDRVKGLRAGGDDYLVKPFAFAELLARLEALLRRGSGTPTTTKLHVGDLEMDLLEKTVHRGDAKIDLLPREFRLLEYFLRHPGRVITRAMLLQEVWQYHFSLETNVVDVHISNLRKKIDTKGVPSLIVNIRGAGFMLNANA